MSGNGGYSGESVLVSLDELPPLQPATAAGDLRQRWAPFDPLSDHVPPPNPATQTSFGQKAETKPSIWKRLNAIIRAIVAPTDKKKWDDEVYPSKQRPRNPTLCNRILSATFSAIGVIVSLILVTVIIDYFTTSADVSRMRSLQILLRNRDHVEIQPLVKLKSGAIVLNVMNPAKPISTIEEVRTLRKKLDTLNNGRALPVDSASISSGFIRYTHISSTDPHADAMHFNVTLDGLYDVMKRNLPADMMCEGAIHYGVERNAIFVQRWADKQSDSTASDDYLLYNPMISDRSTETVPTNEAIQTQRKCRISDIVTYHRGLERNLSTTPVTAFAMVEYTTPRMLKQRRRVQQPLLECIENVLKLSGMKQEK